MNTTYMLACVLHPFSRVRLLATLWTEACQAPLSMGFSRQEYWSGHTHFQGIFLTQGSNPGFLHLLALAGGFFTTSASWEAQIRYSCGQESPPSE